MTRHIIVPDRALTGPLADILGPSLPECTINGEQHRIDRALTFTRADGHGGTDAYVFGIAAPVWVNLCAGMVELDHQLASGTNGLLLPDSRLLGPDGTPL